MKINNIGYLIKEGLKGIFLHGFMSFAAICVTVACLMIVGTFSSLIVNLNLMVEDLNQTNEVLAIVDQSVPDDEARSIGTTINKMDNIAKAEFISNDKALDTFIANFNNPEYFNGVDSDDLRHRYSIRLVDNGRIEETVKALESVEGIAEVKSLVAVAKGFATIQDVLHLVSFVVIGILLVVSLLIISNTVKLAMYDRRDEIAIMKMVGATNGFIRLPFVVEGFALGMLGAAIAFGLEWLLYDYLVGRIQEIALAQKLITLLPFTDAQLLFPMILTFAGAGLFVGVVGSWTSIRKFMNV